LEKPSLLNEWEPSVHHVDESESVIRGGVITFLDDVGVNERNGIHKRSLGDRTDYIAAVRNTNIGMIMILIKEFNVSDGRHSSV
jgi:hypothetical protein